ncbi:hypothetical protein [Methylorubrum extorquens]|uniref:Uncharacterized protein n=1 Tax=Methylorubrum extorquens (strain ATCC 14718 / DSM 1338 / JCM 2805 / NCIMB 9133 / AM1) TaxID=272630 RepID=C5B667_METEA|nr:hypothetical protein [Methylorubrum extorquens]ACS43949.1 Hypothetical protein MexAM1_META2p1185 [Methylorubrum extorquens AM1]MCP1546198.1 hypothetical protein [Methylorubrum extorquens]MCP1590865.1 hypothetical protein [Methylorubrum extorquens]
MFTLLTPKARDTALGLARGDYQLSLLRGSASWAGSDLKGAAARNGASYASSRESLLARLVEAGLYVERTKGERGRTVVVVMTAAERRRSKDRPAAEAAAAVIEKAKKAKAAAERKAAREKARAERDLAADLPTLEVIAHAR